MKQYDVIVIGSGIGGCAAAMMLAHSGKSVLMLEKNGLPGGRLSSYNKNGFQMDVGVHMISCGAKGAVAECLERVGAKDAVKFVSVRPQMAINGQLFKFPRDVKGMVPEEDFNAMMKYIMDVRSYNEEQIEAVDDITLEEHLMTYTKNELVHRFMGQIAGVYCVVPSWMMSAGEFIRCFNRESAAHASGYPEGGCIAITNAYLEQLKKFGGELKLSTPVEKIIVENDRAVGVVAGGEEYRAEMIVSNAGLKETILDIMKGEGFEEAFVERIRNLVYSQGTSVARIALDKPLSDIMMYSNSNGMNPRENERIILSGNLPDKCTTMLVSPSNFSGGVAPDGMQYVCAGAGLPIGATDDVAKKLCDRIVDTAAEYIPDLKDHVIFVDKTTPEQFSKIFGKDGCVIGLAQIPGQVGNKRPPIKSPLEGLYFVGSETGKKGGVGAEFAVNSAMEFFDLYGQA